MSSTTECLPREELERLRDQHVREAEALLYQTPSYPEERYAAGMLAANAHATLARIYQDRLDAWVVQEVTQESVEVIDHDLARKSLPTRFCH